jgi:hypothetical protein
MTVAGILCIAAGVFAFGIGLFKNPVARPWQRWRLLSGGLIAIALGILLLTGVIGE